MTIDHAAPPVRERHPSQRILADQSGDVGLSDSPGIKQLTASDLQPQSFESHSHKPDCPPPHITVHHPLQYSAEYPSALVPQTIHPQFQTPTSALISSVFDENASPIYESVPRIRQASQGRMLKKIGRRHEDPNEGNFCESTSAGTSSQSPDVSRSSASHTSKKDRSGSRKHSSKSYRAPGPSASSSGGPIDTSTISHPGPSAKVICRDELKPSAAPRDGDRARSMQIAGLLSNDDAKSPAVYNLSFRQQPEAARACGYGERDRRVIDPPPILEMKIEDPSATADEIREKLKSSRNVMHCTLWHADEDVDDGAMPDEADRRQQRRLMGNAVASPFVGLDEHDVEGCFFTFPDLSCRSAGRYRLRFVLVVLDPDIMLHGGKAPFQSTIISDIFQVYPAKDFTGMKASTELTKRLKAQGCLIPVKKGTDRSMGDKSANGARESDNDNDNDDDDDDDVDETDVGKHRKKRHHKRSKK